MLNYIDLFGGCGGLSEGFYLAGGYTGLAHVEWEKPMINTLRNRLMLHGASSDEAKQRVCHFDIQNTNELIFGTIKSTPSTRIMMICFSLKDSPG